MATLSRRHFLVGTALSMGAATLPTIGPGAAQAWASPVKDSARPAIRPTMNTVATTLAHRTEQKVPGKRWSPAKAGSPFPLIVRSELAQRSTTHPITPLAVVGQMTDTHITDSQSPARMEYVHSRIRNAYRPHELLACYAVNAVVKRLNKYNYGPISGRTLDCVVHTGDITDNHETIELEWYLKLMSGGKFIPNTGHPDKWEGVETSGNPFYWQIQDNLQDLYKQRGFPTIKNFFDVLLHHEIDAPGLKTRWYSIFGNHDNCFIGTFPKIPMDDVYTGAKKLLNVTMDDIFGNTYVEELAGHKNPMPDIIKKNAEFFSPVTPDPRRIPFTREEFIEAHHKKEYRGAGPTGHGLTPHGPLYYTFPVSDKIQGIALDLNVPTGGNWGWMGGRQMTWLEKQLKKCHSEYYSTTGKLVKGNGQDKLVMIFSHEPLKHVIPIGVPSPNDPDEVPFSHSKLEVVDLVQRFPNVIAWVDGHTHSNELTPYKHKDPRRSFWEINTASFIDWPHLGRLIEVVDNNDSTLSIYTTLFEPELPLDHRQAASVDDRMAALYREIALNDFENEWEKLLGQERDCNAELILTNPLATRPAKR